MNNPTDNPPAFPTDAQSSLQHDHYEGMTLRDYFAAKAREEDIEQHRAFETQAHTGNIIYTMTREEAKFAYADAMLLARQKGAQQ